MPDDPNKRRPRDSKRISITEEWELSWWSKELGVTKEKIKEAVDTVGTSVDAVKKYLKK